MKKKILATVLAAIVIVSLLAITVCAEPYVETKISSTDKTEIEGTDFDTGEGNYKKAKSDGSDEVRAGEEVRTEFGESGYNGNVSYISSGDWVQYTVNVEKDGKYNFKAYIATANDNAKGITMYYDGNEFGKVEALENWGWQIYDWYPVGGVDMTAGEHIIKVQFNAGLNFAAIEVTPEGYEPPTQAPTEAPTTTVAAETTTVAEDTKPADESETASATESSDDEEISNVILFVVIGIAAVIIIVIVIVLVTRKKK